MLVEPVGPGRTFIGRLAKGDDLLVALSDVCLKKGIRLGTVRAIGAVARARVGYYDQRRREYAYLDLDGPHELISLEGNVSLKDGKPFIHAHVALMAADGRLVGGHLATGTEVFACEFILQELLAGRLERFTRVYDGETGLYLWPPG